MSDKAFVESVEYTERTISLKRKSQNGKTLYCWFTNENQVEGPVFESLKEAQDYMGAKSTIVQLDEKSS